MQSFDDELDRAPGALGHGIDADEGHFRELMWCRSLRCADHETTRRLEEAEPGLLLRIGLKAARNELAFV